MAEQRGDDQPGQELQPSTPSSPQPLDEEQLRQFQQFQQFQDYLKFTEAQRQGGGVVPAQPQPSWQQGPPGELVPAPPRKMKAPKWATWLGKKVLAWVIAILLLGIAATWAYNHFFPNDDGKTSAEVAAEGGGTYKTNQILTTASPYESVRRVYSGIAQHGPGKKSMVDYVCGLFDERTQQQFANDLGFPDCARAVEGLHAELQPGKADSYAESISQRSGWKPEPSIPVSSCAYSISGGPALGDFMVSQVQKGQWLITGHTPGPKVCPAPAPTTSPTN
ncbi:hypothetical protein SAMN05421504_106169 [Amycolatopsis xylanica]|uniref:Uncharacterized protein n=1 Tax=Amycolatopsis xylanica TaxID=589385 RepID=A0A1H3LD70_9PSEU|nr:hypothetical protein [Amycolatopsis xylanica]SDY62527.1 hypothetical protein SAMN05421504_106169 [Amycolatopsis xylanica]